MSASRETYAFWHKDTVRFNDLDALGHVSSTKFHEYFAGARTALFNSTIEDWPNCNIIPVLKTSNTTYEQELLFPQNIEIGLRITRFGTSSFTVSMAIFSDQTCHATSENVFVFVDRSRGSSTPIPEVVKDQFIEITKFKDTE